jgi:solute carrier family 25 (mitochondrial folate transporter), member 32
VLRARMQTQQMQVEKFRAQPATGLLKLIGNVWRNEGFLGFYKGMGPNLLRVVPSTCITFLVYENVKWALPLLGGDDRGHEPSP